LSLKASTLRLTPQGWRTSFEMAASAMEAKRLGLCQKSLFVVPNHLTLQWANEFLRLYPSAKLLVASKKDFETANRKKFCARIATGDYDAVIIGHSQFERIPISAERQEKLLREQIDDIENALNEMKYQRGENFSIKQMEKTRKSLQTRLDKLLASDRKDDVITFEQLGVDRLFVDESHGFKNLFLYTKMRNVAGLSTSEAQKSSDMFMKCRYMDELTGGKGVIFATGTPVSNSMTELYTVMRYLQYGTLQQKNLTHFDCWASTFGETATAIELAPEGTGYRARTRFAKFFNLPELMNMFKEVADIKTSDQLNLPVPEAKFETVVVQPSEIQKEMVASLSERAAEVHSGSVDPSVDNMLKITSDGRKIGLDQRLMNPLLPDDENSKLNACVNNVYDIWDKGTDKKLTQLVFCDLSTPKKDSIFNVYDDIKTKLITRGVPENEIAFIHDADSEAKKKELFSKVRTGQVRVLLGSTQKMGAGTNVQDKLVAVHHLDVGWRPSDMTQRNGRIIRQGNQNKEVQVYQYVTEGTFDAYLYQTLENKQKFISQIMTSKSPVRSCDDVDEQALSYAEIKALCAGNPLIKEKMDLDIDVARLKVLKADHQSKVYRLEDQLLKYFPAEIEKYQSFIKGFEKDIEVVEQHPLPKEDFVGITVGTKHFTDKELAGEAILATCKSLKGTEPVNIGEYRGFKMELDYDSFNQEYQLTLKGNMSHRLTLGTDPRGNLIRMDNALSGIPNRLEKSKTQLDNLYNQQEAAKVEVKKPFPLESELSQKSARLAELDAALNMDEQSEVKQEKEKRPSVLAELKRHSDGIPHGKNKSDMEVAL
ncbi:helicase-related protein, partial [Faecalimonas sp.]